MPGIRARRTSPDNAIPHFPGNGDLPMKEFHRFGTVAKRSGGDGEGAQRLLPAISIAQFHRKFC
jgi:hypothetical protein